MLSPNLQYRERSDRMLSPNLQYRERSDRMLSQLAVPGAQRPDALTHLQYRERSDRMLSRNLQYRERSDRMLTFVLTVSGRCASGVDWELPVAALPVL